MLPGLLYIMSERVKKIIKIAAVIAFVIVVSFLGYLSFQFAMNKEEFKFWMDNHFILGKLVYVIMVILQIMVAVIPGGPIEVAGGYAFGAVLGVILFMIGSGIGSILVFLLVRKLGQGFVEVFFKKHEIKRFKFLQNDKKRDAFFLILFIIPGAPKDLLSYVAGLTPMKLSFFAVVCTIGRLPAVVGSAISGAALDGENYIAAALAFGVTLLISGIGIFIYYKIMNNREKKENKNEVQP